LLTATASGVASGKERLGGERGDGTNGTNSAAACVTLGMGGTGLDGSSLSHRMSAAAATAALSQDGLPPIALWIAGRDDALPLALLLVRLMEAGHPSPPPPAAAARVTATATAGGRLWGSLADSSGEPSGGRRGRERMEGATPATPTAAGTETQGSSKRAGKTAAKAAAASSSSTVVASKSTLACSDQQWGDAVLTLVPALLAAMSATDAGRPAPPWRSSALRLVERLVAAVRAPEVLAAPEAATRAAALSAAFVAFAQVRPCTSFTVPVIDDCLLPRKKVSSLVTLVSDFVQSPPHCCQSHVIVAYMSDPHSANFISVS
jgi:hypothetical protein